MIAIIQGKIFGRIDANNRIISQIDKRILEARSNPITAIDNQINWARMRLSIINRSQICGMISDAVTATPEGGCRIWRSAKTKR